MALCAYCHQERSLTREHIVPSWYIKASGNLDVFNMRAPIAQTRGELIVKDVCAECNNIQLSELDSYGKSLYEEYFEKPVSFGDSILFNYDTSRLIRWLLKLSYNGARATNSDTKILSKFDRQILGAEQVSSHVRVFLNLVSPTSKGNEANFLTPRWFRLTQVRMSFNPELQAVQRQICINSFAFTIFAVAPNSPLANKHLNLLSQEFSSLMPGAKVLNSEGSVIVKAAGFDALQSIENTYINYPIRHKLSENAFVKEVHKGKTSLIFVYITLELIEDQDVKTTADVLTTMVANKENATAYMQKIDIVVDGFNKDSRELWEIPEVRSYFRSLLVACPFVILLSSPQGNMLKVFFYCWLYDNFEDKQEETAQEFLDILFNGLNKIFHRLGLSPELNTKISNDAIMSIFSEQIDY